MGDKKRDQGSQTGFETAERSVASALEEGKESAARALHDARDDLGQKASEIAAEAKDATVRKVEETQHGIGASLASLGGALHAAGNHLAEQEQGTASKLIQDTAEGIERLASSLKDKSLEEVINEIRTFGRDNAGALLAGSALAGLALGRLVRTTSLARPDGRPPIRGSQAARSPTHSGKDRPAGENAGTAGAGEQRI
jgi:F0F1-type ATP synthase membrane subunit b/b'